MIISHIFEKCKYFFKNLYIFNIFSSFTTKFRSKRSAFGRKDETERLGFGAEALFLSLDATDHTDRGRYQSL